MNRNVLRASYASLAIVLVAQASLSGQQTKPPTKTTTASFDRRVIPTPGKNPELHIPTWSKVALSNGAQLVVLERHGLPLVSVQINFIGGANQYEPASKTGL